MAYADKTVVDMPKVVVFYAKQNPKVMLNMVYEKKPAFAQYFTKEQFVEDSCRIAGSDTTGALYCDAGYELVGNRNFVLPIIPENLKGVSVKYTEALKQETQYQTTIVRLNRTRDAKSREIRNLKKQLQTFGSTVETLTLSGKDLATQKKALQDSLALRQEEARLLESNYTILEKSSGVEIGTLTTKLNLNQKKVNQMSYMIAGLAAFVIFLLVLYFYVPRKKNQRAKKQLSNLSVREQELRSQLSWETKGSTVIIRLPEVIPPQVKNAVKSLAEIYGMTSITLPIDKSSNSKDSIFVKMPVVGCIPLTKKSLKKALLRGDVIQAVTA